MKKNLNPSDVSSVYYTTVVSDKIAADGGSCQVCFWLIFSYAMQVHLFIDLNIEVVLGSRWGNSIVIC